jgi:hypothetical protein
MHTTGMGRRVRARAAARGAALVGLGALLVLTACGSSTPGEVRLLDVPTPVQLEEAGERASESARTFFRLLADGDERACRLLGRHARRQLERRMDRDTCAKAVERFVERGTEEQRERLREMTFVQVSPSSGHRVELLTEGREPDDPIVVEQSGEYWIVTSL